MVHLEVWVEGDPVSGSDAWSLVVRETGQVVADITGVDVDATYGDDLDDNGMSRPRPKLTVTLKMSRIEIVQTNAGTDARVVERRVLTAGREEDRTSP